MKTTSLFFFVAIATIMIASPLAVNPAFAASLGVIHPNNGDTISTKGKTVVVYDVDDLPPDREATITVTLRDKETGDEIDSKTITTEDSRVKFSNGAISVMHKTGNSNDYFHLLVHLEGENLIPDRTFTLTLTIRDKETGDELTTSTIELLPS